MNKKIGNKHFNHIKKIKAGELIFKFPGTDLIIAYDHGTVYVNSTGNIGHLSLKANDFYAKNIGKDVDFYANLGRVIADLLNQPEIKKQNQKMLKTCPLNLFYSKTNKNTQIITIPSIKEEEYFDNETIENMVIAKYSILGNIPNDEEVFKTHSKAIEYKDLFSYSPSIETETSELVQKFNQISEKYLTQMKEYKK